MYRDVIMLVGTYLFKNKLYRLMLAAISVPRRTLKNQKLNIVRIHI